SASANVRSRLTNQLTRMQSITLSETFINIHHQLCLILHLIAQNNYCRSQFFTEFVGQIFELCTVEIPDFRGYQVCFSHGLGLFAEFFTQGLALLLLKISQSLFQFLVFCLEILDLVTKVYRRTKYIPDRLQLFDLIIQIRYRTFSCTGFYPADTCCHRSFTCNPEQSDLTGLMDVNPSTQLPRKIRVKGNHPHGIPIFLAK